MPPNRRRRRPACALLAGQDWSRVRVERVNRLDRLGRSLGELLVIVDDLRARGIHLVSLEERLDTSSAADELVFRVFGAIAHFERRLINEAASVTKRPAPKPDLSDPRLDERVEDCTMEDVVLSFAGWKPPGTLVHRAIDALSPGDPLSLSNEHGQWKILDGTGRQVGRMAKKWSLPQGMQIAKVSVQGIFQRSADDEKDEKFKLKLLTDTWEVVLPRILLTRRQPR